MGLSLNHAMGALRPKALHDFDTLAICLEVSFWIFNGLGLIAMFHAGILQAHLVPDPMKPFLSEFLASFRIILSCPFLFFLHFQNSIPFNRQLANQSTHVTILTIYCFN